MSTVPKNHMTNSVLSNEEPLSGIEGVWLHRTSAENGSRDLLRAINAYRRKHEPWTIRSMLGR